MRLIDVVRKTHHLPAGTFANISDDLGAAIGPHLPPLVQMAYAYARRTVAAGLLYQGVFSLADYQYIYTIFQGFQLKTGHTVEFQEEAFDQAVELLQSYDPRLNKELCRLIVSGAQDLLNNRMPLPNAQFDYETIINFFLNNINSNTRNGMESSSTQTSTPKSGCCVFLTMPLIFTIITYFVLGSDHLIDLL